MGVALESGGELAGAEFKKMIRKFLLNDWRRPAYDVTGEKSVVFTGRSFYDIFIKKKHKQG